MLKKGPPYGSRLIKDFIRKYPDHPKTMELEKALPRKEFTGEWASGGAGLAAVISFIAFGGPDAIGDYWFAVLMVAAFGAVGGWFAGNIAFSMKEASQKRSRRG